MSEPCLTNRANSWPVTTTLADEEAVSLGRRVAELWVAQPAARPAASKDGTRRASSMVSFRVDEGPQPVPAA